MSTYGLQIFDANGEFILDTDWRITRLVLQFTVYITSGTTEVVSVPGATTDGTWIGLIVSPNIHATIVPGAVSIYATTVLSITGTHTVLILRY